MTTPQDSLYRLGERIRYLSDLFEADEDGESIFDSVKQMRLDISDLIESQQRQENTMNLIIRLLSKDGK